MRILLASSDLLFCWSVFLEAETHGTLFVNLLSELIYVSGAPVYVFLFHRLLLRRRLQRPPALYQTSDSYPALHFLLVPYMLILLWNGLSYGSHQQIELVIQEYVARTAGSPSPAHSFVCLACSKVCRHAIGYALFCFSVHAPGGDEIDIMETAVHSIHAVCASI